MNGSRGHDCRVYMYTRIPPSHYTLHWGTRPQEQEDTTMSANCNWNTSELGC